MGALRNIGAGLLFLGSGAVAATSCTPQSSERLDQTVSKVIADASATFVLAQAGSFTTGTVNLGGLGPASLAAPRGLAVDSANGIYVADLANHRVLHFASGETTADAVFGQPDFTSSDANNGGISAQSTSAPVDVAFFSGNADGGAGAGLLVADSQNHRILFVPQSSSTATRVYGQNGDFTTADRANPPTADSLFQPMGVDVAPDGTVFAVDQQNHRVLRFSAGSTTADRVYGQLGSFTSRVQNIGGVSADSLKSPSAVAVDPAGGIYVADGGNWRALHYPTGSTTADRVYGQQGSFAAAFPNNGGRSADSLDRADGLLALTGELWISDTGNNRALRYEGATTTASLVLGQRGSFTSGNGNAGGRDAESLNRPAGLAMDALGDLYVADSLNHRVLGFAESCATVGCDDGNPCTDDTCEPTGICSTAVAAIPPTACGGFTCDPATLACRSTCAGDAECASAHQCVLGRCVRTCTASSECPTGSPCVDGWCCGSACSGPCEACDVAGMEGTCSPTAASADPSSECRGYLCDGSRFCTTSCTMDSECASGFRCNGGVCTKDCTDASDCNTGPCVDEACCSALGCAAGTTCNYDDALAGTCIKVDGATCTDSAECGSGQCVDGVCCDTVCDGTCEACNVAGARGTCSPIPDGLDPDEECPTDAPVCGGFCDGARACRSTPAGTVCVTPFCSDGILREQTVCDGTGAVCPVPASRPCADAFNCTPNGLGCRTSCTSASHCAPGATCQSGRCVVQTARTCTEDSQCPTGFCTDGFCCNDRCSGVCRSCGIAGTEGVCIPHAAGTDPDRECSENGDVCVGSCNGDDQCTPAALGTLCSEAACADRVTLSPERLCPGEGQRCPSGFQDCSPGSCSADACQLACSASEDCSAGAICRDGACVFPSDAGGCACRGAGRSGHSHPWWVLLALGGLARRRSMRNNG